MHLHTGGLSHAEFEKTLFFIEFVLRQRVFLAVHLRCHHVLHYLKALKMLIKNLYSIYKASSSANNARPKTAESSRKLNWRLLDRCFRAKYVM